LRPFAAGWLAVLVVSAGHDALCDALVRGDVAAAQLEQPWRVGSPWTAVVLDALGAVPERKVAKGARRALFKQPQLSALATDCPYCRMQRRTRIWGAVA
jgi:hypothetical protein